MEVTKQGVIVGDQAATARDGVALVGRILLAAMFVISGWGKLTGFAGTAGYIASRGPAVSATSSGCRNRDRVRRRPTYSARLENALVGARARRFLVIITPIFHNFWSAPPDAHMGAAHQLPEERLHPGRHAAPLRVGAGRYSVDKG
jgi:putative oxidoreductase